MQPKEQTFDITGTPLAAAYAAQQAGGEPKVSEIYKELKVGEGDKEVGAAIDQGVGIYKGAGDTPINEDDIRNRILSTFQQEVDATNSVYTDKVREARTAGLSRVGSGRAIAARSGTLGSDFGNAQDQQIKNANNEIVNSIEQERLAKIAEIMGRGNSAVTAEIAAKRKAQEEGLDSYVKFLGAKTERKKANLKSLSKALITQGIKPEELNPDQLKQIADSYGVTPEELASSYITDKKEYDENKVKEAAAAAKDAQVSLSAGQKLFTLDPKTGQYVQVANNPSSGSTNVKNPITIAEAKTLALPLSIVGQSQEDLIASLGSPDIPAWFAEKAQRETGDPANLTLGPAKLSELWEAYRTALLSTFEGDGEELY